MLVPIGKFLRKIRIDRGEILSDMAKKLGVTASFLSAVENGKKRMPALWNNHICELYNLDKSQIEEFTQAIAESEARIELNLDNATTSQKKLAISFARKFSDFDDRDIQRFMELMKGGDKTNEL